MKIGKFYHITRCWYHTAESRGLVATKQESRDKISRFCRKVALSDKKVGCEIGVFAQKFHTQKPKWGPKILRDSELGFWGCAKRLALLEAQPPPHYAPLRLSDFPQAEYVKTLYRLPCVGALAMVLGHQRSGAYYIYNNRGLDALQSPRLTCVRLLCLSVHSIYIFPCSW